MTATEPQARGMYVGGEWVSAASTLDVVDPATEETIATIPGADADDVDRAVAAAAEASRGWAATPHERRVAALHELADRLSERIEELARLDAVDSGNPITAMRRDVRGAIDDLRYFAGIATEIKGVTFPTDDDTVAQTRREPYGVVGRIIPFNHPLKFAVAKSAAPLAAGNAVILKPSEHTSLSALAFAELTDDVLPPGVFNVVTGLGATTGAALVAHPGVPRIAFTGGVPTGRAILRGAAEHIKHVSLELGGKNPMIVFPDADPVRAGDAAVAGMNLARSMGQSCQSNSRVFVHEDIRAPFQAALEERIAQLRVGDPTEDTTDMGPLAFRDHYERVLSYVQLGRDEGARLVTGGSRPTDRDRGFFLSPTVFADVDNGSRLAQEEIFGPVVALLGFRDVDQVVELANDVPYGLTAKIWTNDVSLALRTANRIQAGYVWINGRGAKPTGTPFGGYKHSGLGKEGSLDELLSYTREKTIVTTLL